MESYLTDRQAMPRYMIQTGVRLHVGASGEVIHTSTVNLGRGGVLVIVPEGCGLCAGDWVNCVFDIPDRGESLIPMEAEGTVVRVEDGRAAIQFGRRE